MDFLKIFLLFFVSALAVFVSAEEHKEGHAHGGHSHVSVAHLKHGNNYEYKIEHEKHGAHHGSSHPHGYGGYGDGGH